MRYFVEKHRGHSLIELMVVLVITSVLVLVAIPLFDSYMDETKIDELQALILKAAASQEKHFAAKGVYAASGNLLANYDFPPLPNDKMKLFTGIWIEEGTGMTYWVNGSYDIGKAERECWIYRGSDGTMQRLTSSDPVPFTGVNCN
jgi:prepilin-type N-terminal cleavage/methylation domain-containing protein